MLLSYSKITFVGFG